MSNALKNMTAATKSAKVASPQNVRTPGRTDEVKNNAGGYVFTTDDKSRLERFLIIGTDGGTYYVGEQKLTKDNADFVRKMIAKDERLVVDTIVDVSVNGRAYRNSPALYALALVMTEGQDKAYAREAVQKVARTSTHLFEFAQYVDDLGGWGRAKRKAVAEWYETKDADQLAYQAVKYRQRDGWTHRDLFRLSHPQGVDQTVGSFILGKPGEGNVPLVIAGFGEMQQASSEKNVVSILGTYKNLPWETIPTQFLKSVDVWKTLLYNGQLKGQALVRNITRLARLGAFSDMRFAADYAKALTDEDMIRKTRLHPINFLNAIVVYTEGQVDRSGGIYSYGRKKDWATESVILDALNDGFYTSFKTVEPAGKRTMLAIDVSGSMSSAAMGLDMSCAQVSGALAMTVARTEPAHIIRGFTTSGGYGYGRGGAQLTDLGISAKTELSSAMQKVQHGNFGGTDCAQPMLWALENKVEVDTFAVITDNETWAGTIKPVQALKKYRDQTGIPARLAVFGVAATPFTIADPKDRGMMDFVGFDSNAPRVFADFSAGRL
jgi:60 kDa SS-A/Ro ribonucleoprotein